MARGTKKVGIAGKYGPRYGVTIRKRIKEVSKHRQKPSRCPECMHVAVKRESSGIWKCRHCQLVFAAGAYSTRMRSFKKDESISAKDKAYKEEHVEADETIDHSEEEPVVDEPETETPEEPDEPDLRTHDEPEVVEGA